MKYPDIFLLIREIEKTNLFLRHPKIWWTSGIVMLVKFAKKGEKMAKNTGASISKCK